MPNARVSVPRRIPTPHDCGSSPGRCSRGSGAHALGRPRTGRCLGAAASLRPVVDAEQSEPAPDHGYGDVLQPVRSRIANGNSQYGNASTAMATAMASSAGAITTTRTTARTARARTASTATANIRTVSSTRMASNIRTHSTRTAVIPTARTATVAPATTASMATTASTTATNSGSTCIRGRSSTPAGRPCRAVCRSGSPATRTRTAASKPTASMSSTATGSTGRAPTAASPELACFRRYPLGWRLLFGLHSPRESANIRWLALPMVECQNQPFWRS